jgi:hypothetical protein
MENQSSIWLSQEACLGVKWLSGRHVEPSDQGFNVTMLADGVRARRLRPIRSSTSAKGYRQLQNTPPSLHLQSQQRLAAYFLAWLVWAVVDATHGAATDTREYIPYLSLRAHPSPKLTTPIKVWFPPT